MRKLSLCLYIALLATSFAACGGGDTTFNATVTLLRPDGQALETSASPIPIGSSVLLTFDIPVELAADRAIVESQVSVLAADDTPLPGAFTWSADYAQLTFKPTKRFDYQSTYTVETGPATTTDAAASVIKSSVAPANTPFTTMVRGDLNGDGYADLVMASPNASVGAFTQVGKVYVYYGAAAGIPTTPSVTIPGSGDNEDVFGISHDVADLNGDGFDDLIVGEPGHESFDGAAYVFNGAYEGVATTPNVSLIGTATEEDRFGWRVANIGDANGDGFDDLGVSAPTDDFGTLVDSGSIHAYYGSATGIATTPDVTAYGETANDDLGFSISGGDLNGDGFDDLVVGTPYYDNDRGSALIYPGSATGILTDAASIRRLTGENEDDAFGFFMTTGDMNGDGFDDVIPGAVTWANGTAIGAAYLFEGSATGISATYTSRIVGDSQPEALSVVAFAGDANGDGFDDIVVGGPAAAAGAQDGKASLYLGSAAGIVPNPATTMLGSGGEFLGLTYPSLDLNGDGYLDAVIGAPRYDSDRGRALIFYGNGTTFEPSPVTVEGEAAGDLFSNYMPPT